MVSPLAAMLLAAASTLIINAPEGDVNVRELLKPKHKTVVIRQDAGGNLDEYVKNYEALNKAGVEVQLHGWCASSCTLYLKLGDKFCVADPTSMLMFHRPSPRGEEDALWQAEADNYVMGFYPKAVTDRIEAAGGLAGVGYDRFLEIPATKVLRVCAASEAAEAAPKASSKPPSHIEAAKPASPAGPPASVPSPKAPKSP